MQPRHLKRLLIGLVTLLIALSSARLYYYLTDDFRLGNITYHIPFKAPWKSPVLSTQEHHQLAHILDQTFYYHRKGSQYYIFISEDQQYILKFFKFKHLRPHLLANFVPSVPPFRDFKQTNIENKKNKLLRVFDGFQLAYQENREGSGLVYLQLIPVPTLHQKVKIIDKLGIKRVINLDDVPFLIQFNGETLHTRLTRQLNKHQLQAAQQSLIAILGMYMTEYRKGIYDADHGVMDNTGFIADQPFRLDVAKLIRNTQMRHVNIYKKDLEHIIWKIDTWLKTHYPQNRAQLSAVLAQEYQRLTGEKIDIAHLDPQNYIKKH